jgi:hypothetical protein
VKRALRRFAAFVLAMPALAAACGACIEDKVAATYDHAVIERAHREHRVMVFAEIRGEKTPVELERAAALAARRQRGIDPASVRSAHAPLALSFALDGRIEPQAAVEAIANTANMPGLDLAVVKVMR